MLKLIKELCELDGVAGWEDEVRAYLKAHAAPYADEMRVDNMGNLFVFKKGAKSTGNKLAICAHMDEVGFLVRSITDEGYLKLECVGGIDRRVIIGKKVKVGPQKLRGVIGIKAYHMVTEEEEKTPPKMEDLYVDIGAKNKAEAEKLVELGDQITFDTRSEEFGDGMLKAKAIDDRMCCALLLKLLERDLPMDCTFIFSAQEEVGLRGAAPAAFSLFPEIALVTDCTTAADLAGVKASNQVCEAGKGPTIPFMDLRTVPDLTLIDRLRKLADEHGIPWQHKSYLAGGTDARSFQAAKTGVRVCGVSAAIRYLHAPASVGCMEDFENMLKLLWVFIEDVAARS